MITFMFSWMGGLIFWVIYLAVHTVTWGIFAEKKLDLLSFIANNTADAADWVMAVVTWFLWPFIFVVLVIYYIIWFFFTFFISKILQLAAKGLLKCIPDINIKFNRD